MTAVAAQPALKSPYPYFGGKSRVARLVWGRFGEVKNFVDPFFGSNAVLLGSPQVSGRETINDANGYVANFWRAVQSDPDLVAHYADWPTNENDLHARHCWLIQQKEKLGPNLEGDAEYYDAQIAGWWVWGMAQWIGGGFCDDRSGPWWPQMTDDGWKLVHLSNAGRGVSRRRVHLGDGRGRFAAACSLGRRRPGCFAAACSLERRTAAVDARTVATHAFCACDMRRLVAGNWPQCDHHTWPDGRISRSSLPAQDGRRQVAVLGMLRRA